MDNVKFKKLHEDAVTPLYATADAAAMDLTAISKIDYSSFIEYDTGLAFEMPEGYVGLIFPRSSISNYSLTLANCVGVLDRDYTGSITFRFKKTTPRTNEYKVGDRIGQIMFVRVPQMQLQEVTHLTTTARGSGSYGSSGE